jgi:hypothetical protein
MMVLAIGFAALGGVLCLWAGYDYLMTVLAPELAALITGICAVLLAALCVWISKKLTH